MSGGNEARLHQRACEVMAEAIELPIAERSAFLARECGADGELRSRVDRLLEHHRATGVLKPMVDSRALDEFAAQGAEGEDADAAPAPEPPLPERIGPFRIVRELGRGSHGVVYEAEQEAPRRRVALKVLQPGWLSAAQAGRFEREAAALARFHHEGLAAIHEAGRAETAGGLLPWFAMELVDGMPLDRFVAERQPPRRARIELLAQIAAAVQHAHEHGVIHRDLKPANVLVQEDGRPKVVDFGVAALLNPDTATLEQLTASGAFVGTLAYVSPEQASGAARQVDARADVYSLGVMAYELLAGRLPYETRDRSLSAALQLIAEFEPVALRRIDPAIPLDLENLVRKAMEKDPARRYASAAALHADLRAWLSDRPVTARAPSALYVAAKFARRHRGLVAGLAVALAALVAGFAMLSIGLARAKESLADAFESRLRLFEFINSQIRLLRRGADTPGAQQRLRESLAELRRIVDDAALEPAAGEDDPRVLAAWADFLDAEADVLLAIGRIDDAEANWTEVLALREALVAKGDPGREIAHVRALAVAHVKLGNVAGVRQQTARELELYQVALAQNEALVRAHPDDAGALDDLCYSYERMADLELRRQRLDEAIVFADLRVEGARRLQQLAGSDAERQFHLARALMFRFQIDDSQLTSAERVARLAPIRVALAAVSDPQSVERRLRLLEHNVDSIELGELTIDGRFETLAPLLTRCKRRLERLLSSHPGDLEIRVTWDSFESARALVRARSEPAAALADEVDAKLAEFEERRMAADDSTRRRMNGVLHHLLQNRHTLYYNHLPERMTRERVAADLDRLDALSREPGADQASLVAAQLCLSPHACELGFEEEGKRRLLELLAAAATVPPEWLEAQFHTFSASRQSGPARWLAAEVRARWTELRPSLAARLAQVDAAAGE
ncbi:MAG: serine/threonine protein kinase [Planctomycetes bacterium]|nr:serine/threonine protein kinase [Planctomycetota bacterium]